jgi:hypothetical protein
MQQPSDGIARELLPHIHLVSSYRFPLLPNVHPEKASEWLLQAPKIARDTAPFYWTYLDQPQDGTVLLVWQSTSLGPEFPSDGYIWAAPEMAYQVQVQGGYTIEMYHQKVGFGPREQIATHSRKRYRLHPTNNPGGPQPDLSLWLIHYAQCDPNERIQSQNIQLDPRIQNTMQTRSYLQAQGQIVQKDFMLHDRSNWPQIQFPRNQARNPPMYNGNAHQARIPQTMAYPTQHPAGPPAKRVRTQSAVPNAVPNGSAVHDIDEEEDISRGDFFDLVTPRDISTSRYKQNHEWMEEVLSSPYSMSQIVPTDLGLGKLGELASITDGFFDAPFDPDKDVTKFPYVGRLDPEKADAFRQKANQYIEDTNKEIEKMKAKHAKRMAKFEKGSLLSRAEVELRTAVADPSDVGPEYWRLEGRIDEDDAEEAKKVVAAPSKVDDILAQVEASLGRHAVAVQELRRIQDGGYEEVVRNPSPIGVPSPEKSAPQSQNGGSGTPHSGGMITDADMDMGNSAGGLLDQYPTSRTPASMFGTPQGQLQANSSNGTPGMHVPSPQPTSYLSPQPQGSAQGDGTTSHSIQQPVTQQPSTDVAPVSVSTHSPHPTATSGNTPIPDFSTTPNDFADLGDLDTAGEALAGYGDAGGEMGDMELDMDTGMDDSAFGEAFHGVEPRDDGADDHGDGM